MPSQLLEMRSCEEPWQKTNQGVWGYASASVL